MARSFRICRARRTRAGIATELLEIEGVGLCLHAPDADTAVARARVLFPWLPASLVAIPTEN